MTSTSASMPADLHAFFDAYRAVFDGLAGDAVPSPPIGEGETAATAP